MPRKWNLRAFQTGPCHGSAIESRGLDSRLPDDILRYAAGQSGANSVGGCAYSRTNFVVRPELSNRRYCAKSKNIVQFVL